MKVHVTLKMTKSLEEWPTGIDAKQIAQSKRGWTPAGEERAKERAKIVNGYHALLEWYAALKDMEFDHAPPK